MVIRALIAPVTAAAVAVAVVPLGPWLGPGAAVPTGVCWGVLAGMAVLPADRRRRLGWWLAVPALVSLAATVVIIATGQRTEDANLAVVEVGALLLLVVHVVRWDQGLSLWVVTALTVAAQSLWLLRHLPDRDWFSVVAGCVFWGMGSAVAAGFGGYMRWAAARLHLSVAAARRAQQRQLERDLHDYVAHDLSGMIVQAQAARYAAGDDPAQLAAALARIEEAGHRAMSSMDRALSLLRDHQGRPAELVRHPRLEELTQLVARFDEGAAGPPAVLRVEGDVETLPGEVSETLYRAGVEGLTNVRRHGPAEARVELEVHVGDDHAALTLRSTMRARAEAGVPTDRTAGGTGLAQLRARVEALRGSMTAGPDGGAWRLTVTVPFGGAMD